MGDGQLPSSTAALTCSPSALPKSSKVPIVYSGNQHGLVKAREDFY